MFKRLGDIIFSGTYKSSDINIEEDMKELTGVLTNTKNTNIKRILEFYNDFLTVCLKCPSLEYNCSFTESVNNLIFGIYVPEDEYKTIKSDILKLSKLSDCFYVIKDDPNEWSIQYTFYC